MANNYCGFTYGGTQYGAPAPGTAYPTAQAGYVAAQPPQTYSAPYSTPQTAAQGQFASAPQYDYGYGRTNQAYDATKTYYQQAGATAGYATAPTAYQAPPAPSKTHYSAPPTRNITPATKIAATGQYNNQTVSQQKAVPKPVTAVTGVTAVTAVPTTSYSNYDAAIYSAAATMYVQQQQQQQQQTPKAAWQQFKKGKQRNKTQPRPQQLHYCEVCKISCAGPQTYREHLEGQKHKKREASLKMSASATTTSQNRGNSHHCDLCDVTCTGNDAYAAHVRGSKHQKVVKLHQKLGKPIPAVEPKKMSKINFIAATGEAAATSAAAAPIISSSAIAAETNTVVLGPVPTQDGVTEAQQMEQDQNPSECDPSDDIKPVGNEYIDEIKDEEGKILSFNCKLCECKFNDPNAKEMHMKGRRHRLQYKRKVQPDLVVDYKPTPRQRRLAEQRAQRALMQADYWNSRRSDVHDNEDAMYWNEHRGFGDELEYLNWIQRGIMSGGPRPLMASRHGPPMGHPFFGLLPGGRRPESSDDRHVIARHAEIYPKEEELQTIQRIVSHTERALKFVSDALTENKNTITTTNNVAAVTPNPNPPTPTTNGTETPDVEMKTELPDDKEKPKEDGRDNQLFSFQKDAENAGNVRILKGVMRVGLLAKGLLLQGDTSVQLVVLCAEKPTKALLKRVAAELPVKLKEISADHSYAITMTPEDSCVLVTDGAIAVKVSLTSPLVREQDPNATTPEQNVQNQEDLLPRDPCLQALAALRHAKWFQARATGLQSCVMIMRILRDLCQRTPSWEALDQWAMELFVEKVISSSGMPLSPGDCLRRVMEALSSGFLINGPGILDPCEKEPHDALSGLSKQQKEDLTVSAQFYLRYIAFRQIHKVLGMEPLPAPKFQSRPWRFNRKRKRSGENENEGEGKKSKDSASPPTQETEKIKVEKTDTSDAK